MSRPRTTHKHLPRYVNVIHGAYWYRPPGQKATRIGDLGDDTALYQFMAKLSEPAGPITTMNQLFDKYCAEILPALPSAVTQKFYLVCLKTLRTVFGPAAPGDIKRKDVARFLNAGKAKVMRRRQVAVLSTVLTHAADIWFVDGVEINPCYKLHAMKDDKKKKRKRYVSDAEYAAVYARMPPRVQIAMELSYLTAQRQKDILAWKWADAEGLRMLVETSKTGTRLSVRISERLATALAEAKALKPDLPRVYIVRQGKGKRAGQRYTGGRLPGHLATHHEGVRRGWRPALHVPRHPAQGAERCEDAAGRLCHLRPQLDRPDARRVRRWCAGSGRDEVSPKVKERLIIAALFALLAFLLKVMRLDG